MKSGNVILFPKWQQALEEESVAAIKERKFEEALEKLDKLLSYHVQNYEIYTGKLICLMELERFDEAQDLCESLLEEKDKHFYQYIHIYLTLLFQTNQYDELMEQFEDLDKKNIPAQLATPFEQLYSMSKKMRLNSDYERSSLYLDTLHDAVNQDNHTEQWRLIQQLRKMNIPPNEKVIVYLKSEHVHPAIKTGIYLWLKETGYRGTVEIHKFGMRLEKSPLNTPKVNETITAREVKTAIQEVEQDSPSLYEVMMELLEHYLYVLYPIVPPEEDVPFIAEALKKIGRDYLNIGSSKAANELVNKYIQEIKTTELLYATIADG